MGLVNPEVIDSEVVANIPILFLVLCVVTGVGFLKELLTEVFLKVITVVKSKTQLSFLFCTLSALLSALLDALTVTAVIASVFFGLYGVYHRFASSAGAHHEHDSSLDDKVHEHHREDLEQFRSFLRGLGMHAVVGTMLGGILTMIGEPQNLVIADVMDWDFIEFIVVMAPVTVPVFLTGIAFSVVLEKLKWLDYGVELPELVREVFDLEAQKRSENRTKRESLTLWVQFWCVVLLIIMLVFHVSEIYLIGVTIAVLASTFIGRTSEHALVEAAEEGLPFFFVLLIFFGVVGMVHSQHLFAPVTDWIFSFEGTSRMLAYFTLTGFLSAVSDNVFVATLYISEAQGFFADGKIGREEFEKIAVAINTGTNIPSISTPNGQAAFLFLLMSPLAKLIQLSYARMVYLAAPYAVVVTAVGAIAISIQL